MGERALIKKEKDVLENLEGIIEKNLMSFLKVGNALLQIREARLYRKTHETFEDYCKDRWDISHQHADRLIGSAKVITHLTPIGVKPTTESQTRPLTKLTPELQKEVWTKVVETAPEGNITARHVTKIVKEITGEKIKTQTEKGRKIINKTALITEDFKKAFDNFYRQIQLARIEGWKHTSMESATVCVRLAEDLINA